jgi:uncharacterized protein (DUF1810 family)
MGDARDPFDLERFVVAQDGTYDAVLRELRSGRKTGHWIWFVFPQVAGLGTSAMSVRYALSGIEEAKAYLGHPVLAPRLLEACDALLVHADRSADAILGSVDARKVQSSMTLFHRADPEEPEFLRVLDSCYAGATDPRTDDLLRG